MRPIEKGTHTLIIEPKRSEFRLASNTISRVQNLTTCHHTDNVWTGMKMAQGFFNPGNEIPLERIFINPAVAHFPNTGDNFTDKELKRIYEEILRNSNGKISSARLLFRMLREMRADLKIPISRFFDPKLTIISTATKDDTNVEKEEEAMAEENTKTPQIRFLTRTTILESLKEKRSFPSDSERKSTIEIYMELYDLEKGK